MDDYREANRRTWDAWTPGHARSAFYDLAAFKAGKTSLREIELRELEDVAGKSLLHLQCHFGLDTLSWARQGARVTGVDFSPRAIDLARSLSEELEIPARFVCSDVYDLPGSLEETFDVVFTSYGVLWWLPQRGRWAEIVARHLKPGGIFYIAEFHPVVCMLGEDGRSFECGYFAGDTPFAEETVGSYAQPDSPVRGRTYGWPYGLGEVVTALVSAGLRIDYLREFDYSPYDCFPFTEKIAEDRYAVRGLAGKLPMTFSLKATFPTT